MSADLLQRQARPWTADALCAQTDPEIFFPEPGDPAAAAKRVCAACSVRQPCLEWAVEHFEDGVWGGTSPRERLHIRQGKEQAA